MKLMKYLAFSLSLMILIVNSNPTHEDEERLKNTLLLNYRKDIRPVTNLSTPVEIDADLILHTLYDLDFVNNLLIARYLFIPWWTDEYLTWDPLEYNNISHMYIPKNQIWTPSLMMCNSVNEEDNSDINREVIVYSDGTVELWSLKYMETYCLVNAYTYPFDDHECEIDICVALHVPKETRLKNIFYGNMNITESYKWDIHFKGTANVTNDGISHTSVVMQLRRKITIGIVAMLIPTVMMTMLTLFVFLLPPESGEKVSLAMTIFLSNVLYLVQIDKNTPKNSKYPSLFLLYLMLLSMFSGIVTLGSVVISKLYINQQSQEKQSNLTDGKKNRSQTNKVTDISIISTVQSETVVKDEHQSRKKRNYISNHVRLDAIFLKTGMIMSLIISIVFIFLVFQPLE
ncbi:acetylcholine receptor subunit beta-type acr-2-like [Octopus vulgaris]|uniref:Acetylcholine receptor subunit beta-type acr-2-like n=1 Tax=Octopus vulgaris TaxID=6645 RepID=A0AA36FCI4_OCTVU|nr:acetylcholine receptor subunit beta-type acr-2-like [Octopus vulgaris]